MKGQLSLSSRVRGREPSIARLALLILVIVFAVAPAGASAENTHVLLETFGNGSPLHFRGVNGLAVDQSSVDLLVLEADAGQLTRFKPNGEADPFPALGSNVIDAKEGEGGKPCAEEPSSCDRTPQNGFTFGEFAGEAEVAIDRSGTVTDGDIYVTGHQVVDVFAESGKYLGQITGVAGGPFSSTNSPCGVTVGGAGDLFVAAGRSVYKFAPSSNPPTNADYVSEFAGTEAMCSIAAGTGPTAGSLFVNTAFSQNGNSVLKLSTASMSLQSIVDPRIDMLVAVDPSTGHLYVAENGYAYGAGNPSPVKEFGASGGAPLSTFGSFNLGRYVGLAISPSGSRVYVSNQGSVQIYSPLVTVPDVTTGKATITGNTSATVNGAVNADGVLLEECRFEYGPTTSYGNTAPCSETPAEIGLGSKPVHADLTGLAEEALYHFRLVAKNVNATISGADQTFKTPGKPALNGEWAIDVGYTEARLQAEISPENAATTYRFEWGTDSSYGTSTPEKQIGEDAADHLASLPLAGLLPATTYHWRVVASNDIGVSESPDHTFRTFAAPTLNDTCLNQTFRTSSSSRLPDCRAYELVSPPDKQGGDVVVLNSPDGSAPAEMPQSAADGDRLTYSTLRAFGDAASAPYTSQYLATRVEGVGWSNHGISPPRAGSSLYDTAGFDTQFRFFSKDLCSGWLLQDSALTLAPGAVQGYGNIYRRKNCGEEGYEALSTVTPPSNHSIGEQYRPEPLGASADGTHTVFLANDKLTNTASAGQNPNGEPISQLYEVFNGDLTLVSVLPNGIASSLNSSAGTSEGGAHFRRDHLTHAVSNDGSRVYWSTAPKTFGPGKLYLRLNAEKKQSKLTGGECAESAKGCTVPVSESVGGSGSTEPVQFWAASVDGSRALFSFTSGPLQGDLYEYNLSTKSSALIAEGIGMVLGESEDLSRVYFTSNHALAPGGADGQRSIYLHEAGVGDSTVLVSALPEGPTAQCGLYLESEPFTTCARVTPDGSRFAFVSNHSLTGYDNVDARTGLPALEVYLYDVGGDDGSGKLICASCNPSGSRPLGASFTFGTTRYSVAATLQGQKGALYASRFLSDDGDRLFFESFDALVPRDTNGVGDVYEWEAPGSGDCTEQSSSFSALDEGCINLISSGESPENSEFVDASADGRDVFFRTGASLLPQDPGLIDIYDAREGGGLPEPPGLPAACEGEACQGQLAPPNAPTPASSTFEGAGNVVEKPTRKTRHPKKHKRAKHNKRAKHKGRAGR